MKGNKITILLLFFFGVCEAQYYPDAGRIASLTENADFSDSGGSNLSFAFDGNINTFWESEAVLPVNYILEPNLNNLTAYLHEDFTDRYHDAIDYNLDTKTAINEKQPDAMFRLSIPMKSPTRLFLCSVKLCMTDTVKIFIETTHNFNLLIHLLPTDSYQLKLIKLIDYKDITTISMVSRSPFDLFEMAALTDFPQVYIEADFHKNMEIGQIFTRHMCGNNVMKSEILVSSDHKKWRKIIDLQPQAIAMLPIVLETPVMARYLRVVHTLDLSEYGKAMVWELKVYDRFGPYGKAEQMAVNTTTMHDRIGVNGFWGWGFNTYADNIPSMQGADKYQKIGNLARSYHNLNWDIIKPGDKANYDLMATKGTNVNDWLNWDREYLTWKKAGFLIDACIQFQQITVADTLWKRPYDNAYQYGFEFANHFGNKLQLIDIVEVGNEPWDYPAGFYNQVLSGMAAGIKDTRSKIKVFPAAFQATFKASEKYEYDNYIGSKLDANSLKNLDGLNGHFYSHTFDEQGNRISVSPEDPRSELLGIRNLSKFRDVNSPNKPLIITEFGYDSDGGGESCDHQECVTENQQAAWGLRAALLLLRNNADAVYWYFFANENRNSVLHSRSGLCSSVDKTFIPKKSFMVFAEFQQLLGDCVLSKILSEEPDHYCYLFENLSDNTKYAVIWTINNNDPSVKSGITYSFPTEAIGINYLDDETGWLLISKPKREQEFFVNGFPTVIRLK
ncbi:MAG: discoidin domain-containing protein [Bacteroidales bacterium]|nr:discoidin domain-containing protein [Bacteroidales bacterium]